ncbi:hypothetical protein OVA29_04785 [Exiguobacterium sp. SL14]|nr:hypothetical protein [Exiguobacterium sp. SL14]
MTSRCASSILRNSYYSSACIKSRAFSRQSLIFGTALGIGGLIAILPGALYIIRYNPEDAVIDVTFLLIYLFEPLAIVAFVVALIRHLFVERKRAGKQRDECLVS